MLPLLSFHALAAQRGDGLRPELLALLERRTSPDIGLSAAIEPEQGDGPANRQACDESPEARSGEPI
ncbi:hypothetical protein [Paraburkholderia sp. ZP32-5]|uniref:hypothetical protein n=1 Tax=Paraburkholderia sp. ZP32-5 TaxID=2883245 RepID=UPI001F33687A|nr:hypothetical protein [Paraburkholderia sp. ZP32-5]